MKYAVTIRQVKQIEIVVDANDDKDLEAKLGAADISNEKLDRAVMDALKRGNVEVIDEENLIEDYRVATE